MANEEQLAILKQGVEAWNRWREENPSVEIDLSKADLTRANLTGVDLYKADLTGADLSFADFTRAHLPEAILVEADLTAANLAKASLPDANLNQANLRSAYLGGASLFHTNLTLTNLRLANLSGADLGEANLNRAFLTGAVFSDVDDVKVNSDLEASKAALIGGTIFRDLDLRNAIGLEHLRHSSPSGISTDTFTYSKGKIPEAFLRGCGLSDWEIETVKLYNPDLSNAEISDIQYRMYDLRATQALQISPLFISYSHGDGEFVDKVGDCLSEKGIRYWRDIHDMKAGRMERQIDRAIRQNPTVLLVLSEQSLSSDWVEHEVRTARELEKELSRDVLCPVALDGSWKESPWPKRVMEQIMEYNILDFSAWQDHSKFDGMFRKLIDGLELFYKKG